MTRRDEEILFEMLSQIRTEAHQNNIMLNDICEVVNMYLANHNAENEADFGRNVLANLVSNIVDLKAFSRR